MYDDPKPRVWASHARHPPPACENSPSTLVGMSWGQPIKMPRKLFKWLINKNYDIHTPAYLRGIHKRNLLHLRRKTKLCIFHPQWIHTDITRFIFCSHWSSYMLTFVFIIALDFFILSDTKESNALLGLLKTSCSPRRPITDSTPRIMIASLKLLGLINFLTLDDISRSFELKIFSTVVNCLWNDFRGKLVLLNELIMSSFVQV